MRARPVLVLLSALLLGVDVGGRPAAGGPPAPTPLAPASGTSVLIPFTLSWSAVSDPSGIVAYNWQVSPSSSFTPVILLDSTGGQTQDTVSGLPNGTYFWRVQAVNGAFVQGAWSQARSFTVTGAGPGAPGTPALGPPQGYSTFHPMEVMTFGWSAVPGAASYVLQAATEPSFPVLTRFQFDNIPDTTFSFAIGDSDPGNYSARVLAVSASGVAGQPSNLVPFSVLFNNPLPPPPSLLSPANGSTLTLPVRLSWTDVPNPQPGGYELQIAMNSSFSTLEELAPQLDEPSRTVLSLTSGTKFWRVRSMQGDSSPTTAAVTAWSATGSFTVSSAPPRPVSLVLATDPLHGGDSSWVFVQLTAAAPAGGAAIALASSNPAAAPVPATITMPAGTAWMQFMLQSAQVFSPTPVTLTATLNSASASVQFSVLPTSLQSLWTPSTMTGGVPVGAIVMLNGQAPAGGASVSLASNSPAASPPPAVTVAAGDFSVSVLIPTSAVATSTPVTLTASWNGVSAQSRVTLTPQQPPASLTLSPTSTTNGSFGTVTIASPAVSDLVLPIASSNPAVARVDNSVMIPAGTTTGGFNIFTTLVSVQTAVTLSVSGAGVTKSALLTVNPEAPAVPVAPSLFSPANDAQPAQPVLFDWSDVSAATSYELQIDDTSTFPAPLVAGQTTTASQATVGGLPAKRLFWRVRGVNSAGVAGPFSVVRRFTPQAAPGAATLSSLTLVPAGVVGGSGATGTVALNGAAPSGGALVTLSSSSTVAAVLASVTIAAGATSASFPITTSPVTATSSATITGSYNGVTRTATLTLSPPSAGPLPAPAQLSPASDARFAPGQSILFDWSDVSGAASYTLVIDDADTFSSPLVTQTVLASSFSTSALPTTRMWWRVRANDAAGTAGTWSAVRRFEVKN